MVCGNMEVESAPETFMDDLYDSKEEKVRNIHNPFDKCYLRFIRSDQLWPHSRILSSEVKDRRTILWSMESLPDLSIF